MSIEIVTVRNKETGDVGTIRRDWFENPVINAGVLEEVEADAKPYVTGMYRSRLTEPAIDPATIDPDEDEDFTQDVEDYEAFLESQDTEEESK